MRAAHPDILVSGDYCSHNPAIMPNNVQVYDRAYVAELYWSYFTARRSGTGTLARPPQKLKLLDRLLKDSSCLTRSSAARAEHTGVMAGNRLAVLQPGHQAVRHMDSGGVHAAQGGTEPAGGPDLCGRRPGGPAAADSGGVRRGRLFLSSLGIEVRAPPAWNAHVSTFRWTWRSSTAIGA